MCKDKIITVSGEVRISTLLRSILELSIQKESLIYLRISWSFNARPKRKLSIPRHELTNNWRYHFLICYEISAIFLRATSITPVVR